MLKAITTKVRNMESHCRCAFGRNCPHHGLSCGCNMEWAHGNPRLDWGIEIQQNGYLRCFVFNTDNEQFYLCQRHFASLWNITAQNISQMYNRWKNGDPELRYKFRLQPEE